MLTAGGTGTGKSCSRIVKRLLVVKKEAFNLILGFRLVKFKHKTLMILEFLTKVWKKKLYKTLIITKKWARKLNEEWMELLQITKGKLRQKFVRIWAWSPKLLKSTLFRTSAKNSKTYWTIMSTGRSSSRNILNIRKSRRNKLQSPFYFKTSKYPRK